MFFVPSDPRVRVLAVVQLAPIASDHGTGLSAALFDATGLPPRGAPV